MHITNKKLYYFKHCIKIIIIVSLFIEEYKLKFCINQSHNTNNKIIINNYDDDNDILYN
jgi:hypothetical protein